MRVLVAFFVVGALAGNVDPCAENPCLDPNNQEITFDVDRSTCVSSPKECFTTPCPQYDCIDCRTVRCMAPECPEELQVRTGCCISCRDPDPVMCPMYIISCWDGSSVSPDPNNNCAVPECPPNPCDNNPCADSSSPDFNPDKQICTPEPKACFTTPCPQWRCDSVCDPNPCLDGTIQGFDFARPVCTPAPKACFTTPCPQYSCTELDCTMVKCLQIECEAGTRRDTCCGECHAVPNYCDVDNLTCADGSVLFRDPALNCTFAECGEMMFCPMDALLCPDGSTLVRDPKNHCEFPKCDGEGVVCADDVQECPDGSFVSRDPMNDCAFPKCDSTNPCEPSPCADDKMCVPHKRVCVTSPCDQFDCIEPVFCTEELKLCEDGVTSVARDPLNGCEFGLCPRSPCSPNLCLDKTRDTYDESKLQCVVDENGRPSCQELDCRATLCPMYKCSGDQHLETAAGECCARCTDDEMCTMEAKICEDGSSVGRDPKNHCEWEPCPTPNPCDSNPCPAAKPMCIVDWDAGTYQCNELDCAVVSCLAVTECEKNHHVETIGCCPACVPDTYNPCVPNPCEGATPYCIQSPKQCLTLPCPQFDCSATQAATGSSASTEAVKLSNGGIAGVTIGAVVGAALLAVGAVFLCRASMAHKKGTTPLNSHQGTPEPSMRDSQAAAPGVDTGSVSVTVEGEPSTPPATQIVS